MRDSALPCWRSLQYSDLFGDPGMQLRLLRFRSAAFVCLTLSLGMSGLRARDYEVSLRLLNGRTGEPIPNVRVDVYLIYEPPGPRGLGTELVGPVKTSANGVAKFRISEPLPKALSLGGDHGLLPCSAGRIPTTEEVLKHGVVEENLCDKKGKLKGKIVAKPGEVVGFAVPPSWWRRLIPTK